MKMYAFLQRKHSWESSRLQEQIISLIIYCLEESIRLWSGREGAGKQKGNISAKFGLHGVCQQHIKEQRGSRAG